jgi:peroxiredoxin
VKPVLILLLLFVSTVAESSSVQAAEGDDPLWTLLHEEAVVAELNLTDEQRGSFQEYLDGIDLRYFPLRNRSREEAQAGFKTLKAEIETRLPDLLSKEQNERLQQILVRRVGMASLLRDDIAARMRLSELQRKRIEQILKDSRSSLAAIEKEANEGGPRESLEKKYRDTTASSEKQIHALLKPDQERVLIDLIGPAFDMSRLGRMRFKAPELVNTGDWINGSAMSLEQLRGKVVVLHFYACGCINCIHNYPWYREWAERFRGQDVAIIGIHTPEVDSERQIENVRKSAADEKLPFPILVDGNSENWNAWGNSMWPCVYVVDKDGYLRHFWAGELKWNGRDGEKHIRENIDRLLAAPVP